jgi:hypothetical protein
MATQRACCVAANKQQIAMFTKLINRAGFELTPTDDNVQKFCETLKRLEAGLPKSYKDRLKTILARTDINLSWIQRQKDLASYFRCFA